LPLSLNRKVLKQALVALAFDTGGLVSGSVLLTFYPLFLSAPWILALFPAILTIRGNIGGILAGKLATMLHSGEIEPRLRKNSKEFYSFLQSILTLTFLDTLAIGGLAFGVNILFGNAAVDDLLFFIIVPPFVCISAMTVAAPFTSSVGIGIFRRGLDPDVLLYPMTSTANDILVALFYVIIVQIALIPGALGFMAVVIGILGALFAIIVIRQRGVRVFRRTLKEGLPIVFLASLLGTLGGVALASLRSQIERRPSILIIYPALISSLGDIGSILGSMQTTKLALGYVSSFWKALRQTVTELVTVESAGATLHIVFGVLAFVIASVSGLSASVFTTVSVALLTNLVSFMFISVFSILVATQTFKRGLDPDNFVIPVVASVSDISATLTLVFVIAVLGV
jgi:mgtE-like transporter